ncbi:hypothetical protein SUDANB95_02676 [Actinosynnema sp. ALI-1.44]
MTYRQLEGKTAAYRNALPASTIATTLGRDTLPKAQFVEIFTRGCGLGDDDVARWLDVRHRIATQDRAPAGDEDADRGRDADAPGPPRWRRAASLLAAAVLGVVGTLVVSEVIERSATPSATPVTGLAIRAVGSWARIHPARTPELCLTEGRDRTGRYGTAVAAQQPCTEAVLPRVFLKPLGTDVVQIQWHHPRYGIGCLTTLVDGPGRDLVEPREDCAEDDAAQRFRVEPFGPPVAAHFRIRPVVTDQCLSVRDQDTAVGAEILQGRCSTALDQEFLIELIPPP